MVHAWQWSICSLSDTEDTGQRACIPVDVTPRQWRTEGRGQGGGHGPRAQALEGAPAQLVGANFKSRGEFQPSKSSIYAMGPALPMH